MIEIKNKTFGEERALYNLTDGLIDGCRFAGVEDGESALKEARDIIVKNTNFDLRYPLWHVKKYSIIDSFLNDGCRAPIWYASDGKIINTKITGAKCLRETNNTYIEKCDIDSKEFGWICDGVTLVDTKINSEYLFLNSKNIKCANIHQSGKYTYQYTDNVEIRNSILDTKDAFWHSKNVLVSNCIVKGEYLGWFSDGLTLVNCKISGTQPLCYAKNLKLINCTMEDCDLSFEYSDVEATIIGHVDSIKNPRSGKIVVDSVGEIIKEHPVMECNGVVEIRK